MQIFFIALTSLVWLLLALVFYDEFRFFLLVTGACSLLIYWALGYEWSLGSRIPMSNNLAKWNKALIITAYVSFNILAAYKAYLPGWQGVVFFSFWFAMTSHLLFITLKKITEWQKQNKYDSVIFFDDIESRISLKELSSRLHSEIKSILEDTHKAAEGKRPEFHFLRVSYSVNLHGIDGTLKAELYNDQLMTIYFIPLDDKVDLEKIFKISLIDNRYTKENLEITLGFTADNKRFIAWQDTTLVYHIANWIVSWDKENEVRRGL